MWLPAVFGLLGVIVGGVLNGIVVYVLDGRREARALQAAARLLALDVADYVATYETMLNDNNWWYVPSQPLPTAHWEATKELVAARIRDASDWHVAVGAFFDAAYVNSRATGKADNEPLHLLMREAIKTYLGRANDTLRILTPYIRGEHLWGARLRRLVRPRGSDDAS